MLVSGSMFRATGFRAFEVRVAHLWRGHHLSRSLDFPGRASRLGGIDRAGRAVGGAIASSLECAGDVFGICGAWAGQRAVGREAFAGAREEHQHE